ncbi:hypothetical protein CSC94_12640 [Zhengella mangrovi]|uniref:Uncharacterized protein n=1 Tax=Zhengella mangrovi TaxID=1982044 RepID=A0A2G1QLY0_9HYPH|nr:hypothetical protein [Zhengella mangrovi]PHP66533.1 hypothetical protein CSC94_12640 [Zhengella mangrovi]
MADLFSPHMTMEAQMQPIKDTFLGMAHIAGTGPKQSTCRECAYWFPTDATRNRGKYLYSGDGEQMHLQPARCNKPIANKADRRVPPCAKACRLFEPNEDAPALVREYLRSRKNG